MKMKTMLAIPIAAAMLTGAANAAITVSIYTDEPGAATDATIAQAAGLTADATVSVGAINFTNAPGNDSTTSTIASFLNNPAGLSAAVGGHTLNNTYFLFTGTTHLNAGSNAFVVEHDDGLELALNGGIGTVLSEPGPTSPTSTPFTVMAPKAGTYSFQLAYGECCGGPAVLNASINGSPLSGTPEPATWAMMLGGFGLVGASLRRRTKTAIVAA